MRELKHGEEDEVMCKSVEEYAERKAKEASIAEKKATVNNLHDMGIDISLIAKAVNMDEETIKQWLSK